MKNAPSRTMVDPTSVTPRSSRRPRGRPEQESIPPTHELFDEALTYRGELEESLVDLKTRELNTRFSATHFFRPRMVADYGARVSAVIKIKRTFVRLCRHANFRLQKSGSDPLSRHRRESCSSS